MPSHWAGEKADAFFMDKRFNDPNPNNRRRRTAGCDFPKGVLSAVNKEYFRKMKMCVQHPGGLIVRTA